MIAHVFKRITPNTIISTCYYSTNYPRIPHTIEQLNHKAMLHGSVKPVEKVSSAGTEQKGRLSQYLLQASISLVAVNRQSHVNEQEIKSCPHFYPLGIGWMGTQEIGGNTSSSFRLGHAGPHAGGFGRVETCFPGEF